MNKGIIYAIISACSFGAWTFFQQRASGKVNYVFGAILISLTAVIFGSLFLLPKLKSTVLFTDWRAIIFIVLAGLCAFAIDFFALRAYGSGLSVSIVGPIIFSGSIVVACIIGIFCGESITLMKFLGIILTVAGSGVLAGVSG